MIPDLIGPTVVAGMLALALLAGGLWWQRRRLERRLERLAQRIEGAVGQATPPAPGEPSPSGADVAGRLDRLLARQQERQAELEKSHRLSSEAISVMSEGALIADPEGRILSANPALRRLLGGQISPTEEKVESREILGLLDEARRTETAATLQLEIEEPATRTLLLTATPLGADLGTVLEVNDVTDLVVLSQARKDFVANISHELKTPLTAIRGYAETLQDGALRDPQTAGPYVERIVEQCNRLHRLLEDLLTLFRLESTEQVADREPVDLATLASEAERLVAKQAAERGVELTLDAHRAPTVAGFRDVLLRLLTNLLDNAVKYNRPGGSVQLIIRKEQGMALIEVSDTGIGIPERSRSRIFERFFRVDRGRARDEGGTGLGLAIVKHATQIHHGTLEVESRVGRGSTFRVRLPLEPRLQGLRTAGQKRTA